MRIFEFEKKHRHTIVSFDNAYGIPARDLIKILRRVANRDCSIRVWVRGDGDDVSLQRVVDDDTETEEAPHE